MRNKATLVGPEGGDAFAANGTFSVFVRKLLDLLWDELLVEDNISKACGKQRAQV